MFEILVLIMGKFVVRIAIRYELDGSGYEPRWGRGFQSGPGADPTSSILGVATVSRG